MRPQPVLLLQLLFMPTIQDFSSLSTEELVQAFSISLDKPPLSRLRATLGSWPEILRVLTLVIDFDTEVSMNGILGFLENSTGQWFGETIEAFDLIGATKTAAILRRVHEAMNQHGMTPATLRSGVNGATLYDVVSFDELHGAKSKDMSLEVMQIADGLYLYVENSGSQEDPWQLLFEYVEPRRQQLLDALGQP